MGSPFGFSKAPGNLTTRSFPETGKSLALVEEEMVRFYHRTNSKKLLDSLQNIKKKKNVCSMNSNKRFMQD